MNDLRTIHLTSVANLRAAATDWDDLWWRSDVGLPLARAELLAQWVEQFAPRAEFHAVVIADRSRWIAALPLISRRVGWVIPAAGLPCNPWASCGDLLCDADAADIDAAMDRLVAAATALPWHLLWLDDAAIDAPHWQAMIQSCRQIGIAVHCHEHYRVGRLEINEDWNAYQKRLPKNHRQAMHRAARRLASQGNLEFETFRPLEPSSVEPWLREAFDVEDLGWKGRVGTSVLQTPGMFDFFAKQAKQLAGWGQLELAALRLGGRMLAFMYGFRSKDVCFAQKIGYDPQFASFSPGQVLFHHILERFHADGETRALDFMGPMTQSLSRWRPATYPIGRVAMAPRRFVGRAAMLAYTNLWRRFRPQSHGASDHVALPSYGDGVAVESTVGALG